MLKTRAFTAAWLVSASLLTGLPAMAGTVTQTNLVSDQTGVAAVTDPNLVNPWGISFSPTGAFWISDNHTGLTTLYNGAGAIQPLVVTIPAPPGVTGPSAPTGQIFNPTAGFAVTENGVSGVPAFVFDTEDGTISGWAPSVDFGNAIIAVDHSSTGAVYKGLALYTTHDGATSYLLATNFNSGLVEVYDSNFHQLLSFRDQGSATETAIPFSYSPYNVAVLNGRIFVTYARVDAARHDNLDGQGFGFVDEVTITGKLVRRIASHGSLNGPWGLAIAPSSFGRFAGSLLVGNFGDGRITSYRISDGTNLGQLKTGANTKLSIDGLWALSIGNGTGAGSTDQIYFTAGPNGETHGLFGSLSFNP